MKTFKINLITRIGCMAAAAVLMLSSCQKRNDQATPNAAAGTPQHALKGGDDAAYAANPYDAIGLQHNQILHATRSAWMDPNATLNDVRTATLAYTRRNIDPNATLPPTSTIDSRTQELQADLPNFGANVFAETGMSANAQAYAAQLSHALYDAPAGSTYFDIKSACTAVEDQIIRDRNLSATDRESLLKMASVGRYSMLYWLNETNGANGGSALETSATVTGGVNPQVYRIIIVVSWTDYSCVSGNGWTCETFSAGVAVFAF